MSNQATFSTVPSTLTITAEQSSQVALVHQPSVVQHDTQVTTTLPIISAASSHYVIANLVAECDEWQNNAFRTSNEQLYGLLQKCYAYYKGMDGSSDEAKAARQGLNDYIASKGYNFGKATHTLTRIVKCVFGSDRRRTSAYSIVLRSALTNNVGVLEIPAFIRDNGGVEEIRLAKAPNAMTTLQKAKAADQVVASNQMAVVNSTALGGILDSGKIGTNTVLIGTWQADGSIVIRAVVESTGVLNAALASHYTAIKAEIKAQSVEQLAANEAQLKQSAIDAAVSTAVVAA